MPAGRRNFDVARAWTPSRARSFIPLARCAGLGMPPRSQGRAFFICSADAPVRWRVEIEHLP
jgi:hypothetical protein